MLLLAVTDDRCDVSTRYRVAQFAPHLAARGVGLEVASWPRAEAEQRCLLDRMRGADVVLFQRVLPEVRVLQEARRAARRLVYDFDDAIVRRESTRGRASPNLRRWWRFRWMARACESITAGNAYLAALARRHAGHRVTIVPTALDVARYGRPSARPFDPVIGWIGQQATLPYLEGLRAPLEALAADVPGLRIRVIADGTPDLGAVAVDAVPWNEATEVAQLKQLRVGLAPLPDDAWTRGKCGLRLLQYLAAGVPAVASPVGVQGDIVRAGAALGALDAAGWRDAVKRALTDEPEAAALVGRGRAVVERRFEVGTVAPLVYEAWCGRPAADPRRGPAARDVRPSSP